MSAGDKKNEQQTLLPLAEPAANARPSSPAPRALGTHVHRLADGAIVPRCSCFDYDDGDDYAEPLKPTERIEAFAADLVAHGAVLTRRPATRRSH